MKHCSHVTKLRNLIGQKSCDYSIYPRVVYILEWRHPYSGVSCTEYPPNSEHVFLPDWYVKKLPPPTDWGSSFIFLHTHYIWTVLHDLWTFQTLLGFNLLAHTHFITVTENLFSFFLTYLRTPSITPFFCQLFFQLWWYIAQSHSLTLCSLIPRIP